MISRFFNIRKAQALLANVASVVTPYFEGQVADNMSKRPTGAEGFEFHVNTSHYSSYLARLRRHWDVLGVMREDEDDADRASFLTGHTLLGEVETYAEYYPNNFRIWFRSQSDFEALDKAMDQKEEAVPNAVYRFDTDRAWWLKADTYPVRSLVNLVGCEEILETIVKDLQNHQEHQAVLKTLDEDKPMNILLYGAPGTGKTSTIVTLASMKSLPIYIVNANGLKFDNLQAALSPHRKNHETGTRILLFEDFDRFLEHQDISIVMSQILNALDGIDNADSRTVRFFTGNNADAIFGNPAMSNRMTSRFYFPPPTRDMLEKRLAQMLTACGCDLHTDVVEGSLCDSFTCGEATLKGPPTSNVLDKAMKTGINMRQWSAFILRFAFEDQPVQKMIANMDQLDKRAL